MKARKYLPFVVVLVALAALALLALPVALAGGPAPSSSQQHSVRVTMQCDKDVQGGASVNLYLSPDLENPVNIGAAPQIPCGESQVVETSVKADSYAATVKVGKGSSVVSSCSPKGSLPNTFYCSVGMVPEGERPAGGTLRLGKPK
jgi:hypothetical protein